MKKLLRPHWAVILLLIPGCAGGLSWVFLNRYDQSPIAYALYALSFYTLCVLCIRGIPPLIRTGRAAKARRAGLTTQQRTRHFMRMLSLSLGINLVYALFNLISGIVLKSTWMGSNGLYYLMNTLIHGILLVYQRKWDRMPDGPQRHYLGWNCFQICGALLFVLHLTMTGVVFQMIRRNEGSSYPGFMIFAVAAYTFYKLTIAIIRVAQYRRHISPVLGAARNIDLSEAMMSMFSLQLSLFSAFGDDFEQQYLMNSITGGAVCFLVMLGAIGMVLHGSKKKKGYDDRG